MGEACHETCGMTGCNKSCCLKISEHNSPDAHLCQLHNTKAEVMKGMVSPAVKAVKEIIPEQHKQIVAAGKAAAKKAIEREISKATGLHGTTASGKNRVRPETGFQEYIAFFNTLDKYKHVSQQAKIKSGISTR